MSHRSSLRPVSVAGAVQAALLLGLLVLVSGSVLGDLFSGIIAGCGAFLGWRFGIVRGVLLHHLRTGARKARAGLYADALKSFALSAEAWERRRWLDGARGILLGSAARWPFRALSRYNEAWCLARLGHLAAAEVVLEGLLRDQPRMAVAKELLASLTPSAPAKPVPDGWAALGAEPGWSALLEEECDADPSVHDEPTLAPRDPGLG